MFMDNPVFGVGIGNYAGNYIEYARYVGIETRFEEREPHSLYVELLAETGIFGLLIFIGLVYNLITFLSQLRAFVQKEKMYKHWGGWVSSVMISLITYLVTSIFLHGAYIRFFWVFFGLALAILQIGKKIRKFDQQSVAMVEN